MIICGENMLKMYASVFKGSRLGDEAEQELKRVEREYKGGLLKYIPKNHFNYSQTNNQGTESGKTVEHDAK